MNTDAICLVLGLGLVNWLTTTILVESELFGPLRDWVAGQSSTLGHTGALARWRDHRAALWAKATYLVSCHLCTGTWVGLALALTVPQVRPFGTGLIGWLLAGLLVKAIGHLTLVLHKTGESVTRLAPGHAPGDQSTVGDNAPRRPTGKGLATQRTPRTTSPARRPHPGDGHRTHHGVTG